MTNHLKHLNISAAVDTARSGPAAFARGGVRRSRTPPRAKAERAPARSALARRPSPAAASGVKANRTLQNVAKTATIGRSGKLVISSATIADPPILYRPNTRRFGRFQGSKWEPSNQAKCSQSHRTEITVQTEHPQIRSISR